MGSLGRKHNPGKAPGRKIKYTTEIEAAIEKFRNSSRWLKCRLYKLNIDPLCEFPKCNKGASDVHHITTLAEEFPYFTNAVNLDNLRSLCRSCHSKITSLENNDKRDAAKAIFNKKQG